jgi:hypothetical protein
MYKDDGAVSRETNIAVGIFGMSLLYALVSHLIVYPSFTGFLKYAFCSGMEN